MSVSTLVSVNNDVMRYAETKLGVPELGWVEFGSLGDVAFSQYPIREHFPGIFLAFKRCILAG